MIGRFHLRFIAFLVGLACPLLAADKRPNILFFLVDDLRADAMSVYCKRGIVTPNLDRLAQRGVAFDRAHNMGSMQGAVCVPARAMLLSGRSLFRTPDNLDNQLTWPEYFGNQGYRTFITGKWHNQLPALLRSFQEGKAIFLGGMGDQFRVKISDRPKNSPSLVNRRLTAKHASEEFADAAVEFLGSAKSTESFVAFCSFTAPHDPRKAPEPFVTRAHAAKPKPPINFLRQHPFDNGEMTIRDEKLEKWPRSPEAISAHWADYKAIIEHLDEQIGRILAALEKSGLADNTIIVFAGDNGLALGSHGLMGKQNLYQHSLRVPLIIANPGQSKGAHSAALCYLADVFPTLCDLAGLPIPDGIEGLSLAPVLKEPSRQHRKVLFGAYKNVQRSLRDDQFKIIRYPQVDVTQLFDLKADPCETINLAAKPAHAATVKRMLAALASEQAALGDKQPLSVDQPAPEAWSPPSARGEKMIRRPSPQRHLPRP